MTYTPGPDDLDETIPPEIASLADRILGPTRESLEEAGLDPDDPSSPFVHRLLYGDGSDVRIPGLAGASIFTGVDLADGADVLAFRIRFAFDDVVRKPPAIDPRAVRLVLDA